MSGKYAFTKSLKEVRFLFCQTSDHGAATRFEQLLSILVHVQTENRTNQVLSPTSLSNDEEKQSTYTNHAEGSAEY